MLKSVFSDDMFIMDLANNHQGEVEHGLNIIKSVGETVKKEGVKAAIKFQFRQLETLIHPDYINRDDIKHIPRFTGTRLEKSDYKTFTDEVRSQGMLAIATPFDEESIQWIHDLGIDIIKVASCSANDRPLLDAVSKAGKPVIISTGGLTLSQIDWIVSFFESRKVNFAMMHCISQYPTPNNKLSLNQIDLFKNRYPDVTIGWSTHEEQDNYVPVQLAKAKGATLFERHVGIETDVHKLNLYSSRPDQVEKWIQAYKFACEACGGHQRSPASAKEIRDLRTLYRGVWVKSDVAKGEKIERDNVFFSMPLQDGQMISGDWQEGIVAEHDYKAMDPVDEDAVVSDYTDEDIVYEIMLQVKGMLNKARIFVNDDASIEISHHYGLDRFREFGCVIITCINREYAKKLIVQLPRQKHPYHYHQKKEETFQLLYGDLESEMEGEVTPMVPGDTFLVKRGKWHKFHTLHGAIFEEVSTTHFNNDSFYEDQKISKLERSQRKTNVDSWAKAFSWR